MEPITKISQIPASRWALVCCVCRERVGACIQCSVKTCKIAYHVTCAFKNGLAMKAIIDEENDEDGVKLRSYCEKHSKKRQGDESSDSDSGEGQRKKKEKSKKKLEISSEDICIRKKRGEKGGSSQTSLSQARIAEMEASFYNYASIKEAAEVLQLDMTVVDFIFQYWKLKRLANFNKPLITPKAEESVALGKQQEDSLYARMKMFVHLRQDLERVRNLCYMVSRREKLSRSWYRLKEEIFLKQVEVLTDKNQTLSEKELEAVIHANHGDSVYDQLFCWNTDITPSLTSLISILDGSNINVDLQAGANKINRRPEKQQQTPQKLPNPYAKHYLNGMLSRSQRRISSLLPVSRDSSCGENSVKMSSDSLNENSNSEQSSTKDTSKETVSLSSESSAVEVKHEVVVTNNASTSLVETPETADVKVKPDEPNNESTKTNAPEKSVSSSKMKNEKVTDNDMIKTESHDSSASDDCEKDEMSPNSNNTPVTQGDKSSKSEKAPKESIENASSLLSKEEDDIKESVNSSEKVTSVKSVAPTSPNDKSSQDEESVDMLVQPTDPVIQSTPTTRSRSGKDTSKVFSEDTKKNGQAVLEKTNNQRRRSGFNLRRTASTLAKEANAKEQRTLLNKSTRKDISPVKEKQREEDEKLRECLFSTSGSPRGSLSGYRIPKKARTDGASGDCPEKKGGLTPLHEVSQPTVEYPEKSYTRTHCAKGWNKDSEQSAYAVNGENQDQSTRLVIKLRKVPNYSSSQQWQRESDFPETPNTFKVVQNDWNAQGKKSERILRSDRRFLSPDQQSQPLLPDPQTKENGSRYSRRFRGVTQKLSKSDIAYS